MEYTKVFSLAIVSLILGACTAGSRSVEPAKAYCKLNDGFYVIGESEEGFPVFAVKTEGEKQQLWILSDDTNLTVASRPQNYDCAFSNGNDSYRVSNEGNKTVLYKTSGGNETPIGSFDSIAANNLIVRLLFQANMNLASNDQEKNGVVQFLIEVFGVDPKNLSKKQTAKPAVPPPAPDSKPVPQTTQQKSAPIAAFNRFKNTLTPVRITPPKDMNVAVSNVIEELERNKVLVFDTTEFISAMRTAVKNAQGSQYKENEWSDLYSEQAERAVASARSAIVQSVAFFITPYFDVSDRGYIFSQSQSLKPVVDYFQRNYQKDLSPAMLILSNPRVQQSMQGANGLFIMEPMREEIPFSMKFTIPKGISSVQADVTAKMKITNAKLLIPRAKKLIIGAGQIIFFNEESDPRSVEDIIITVAHEARHATDFSMTNRISTPADKERIKTLCEQHWDNEFKQSIKHRMAGDFFERVENLILTRFGKKPEAEKTKVRNSFLTAYQAELHEMYVDDCLYFYSDYEHRAFYEATLFAKQIYGPPKANEMLNFISFEPKELKSSLTGDVITANVVHPLSYFYSILLRCTDSLSPPFKRVCL